MRDAPNRRIWEIIAGVFLLVLGLAAVANEAFPALVILALGGYLLWRQFEKNNWRMPSFSSESEEDDFDFAEQPSEIRQTGAEKVYAHALKAVERAGLNPDDVRVLPVDIGVMAFTGNQPPVVYRTQPVDDDVDYIQPFVQLRLPTKAVGRIKFEILDSDGQALFIREENRQLDRGRNLLTPSARLPIHDAQAMHQKWTLRISADGMPLATHTFEWQESDVKRVRRQITEDGEISNELRTALAENRLQKLSLDELLGYEDGDEQARQQRR
ncbi:MAG: hypothetical protein ABI690_03795 [Chloroflexota bacterium]